MKIKRCFSVCIIIILLLSAFSVGIFAVTAADVDEAQAELDRCQTEFDEKTAAAAEAEIIRTNLQTQLQTKITALEDALAEYEAIEEAGDEKDIALANYMDAKIAYEEAAEEFEEANNAFLTAEDEKGIAQGNRDRAYAEYQRILDEYNALQSSEPPTDSSSESPSQSPPESSSESPPESYSSSAPSFESSRIESSESSHQDFSSIGEPVSSENQDTSSEISTATLGLEGKNTMGRKLIAIGIIFLITAAFLIFEAIYLIFIKPKKEANKRQYTRRHAGRRTSSFDDDEYTDISQFGNRKK